MRILVTGAAGRLGGYLLELLRARGHEVVGADVVGDGLERLDVIDWLAVRGFVGRLQPDIILHPAAWTDVDGCARDPERAIVVNGFGAQHMALAAASVGAAVLYVSTNEVFDGRARQPYREYDQPGPVNPYGYSKLVGERAVTAANPRHYLVRTAWLFAHGGKNFIQTILDAARQGKRLRIVTDEIANPTYNHDLAEAIAALIETERYGIYHLVNEGAVSRYHFARYFLDRVGWQDVPIEPIASAEWLRASRPPAYTALSNLAGRQIGIQLRPWQQAVDDFLRREGWPIGESV